MYTIRNTLSKLLVTSSIALWLPACGTLNDDASTTDVATTPPPTISDAVALDTQNTCDPGQRTDVTIGEVEHVMIGRHSFLQKARIDTGATTTSIGYSSLEAFERDGEKWVKFSIKSRINGEEQPFERAVVRTARIKRHGAEAVERPAVNLPVTIGTLTREIEVTLADRDAFDYPVLIGRNFLSGGVVVDVSKRYVASGGDQE